MNSPTPRDRPFCHTLNKHACWLWQIKCPCKVTVDKKTFNTRPERFLLEQEPPCSIGGCGKSQTLRASRPAHDVADNPYNLAVQTEYRTTGVSAVYSGVGLQKLNRRRVLSPLVQRVTSTDVSCRQRVTDTVRSPDHK